MPNSLPDEVLQVLLLHDQLVAFLHDEQRPAGAAIVREQPQLTQRVVVDDPDLRVHVDLQRSRHKESSVVGHLAR